MRSFLAVVVLSGLAFSQSALAADLPVKAPPPAPVLSWTGWYVGGNVGYSWGNAHTDLRGLATTTAVGIPSAFSFADSQNQRLNGVIGGGQFGYNYEINQQWVLGFEADIQGSGERGRRTFLDPFSGLICSIEQEGGTCFQPSLTPLNGAAVTSLEAKIEWFGTVRMRGGVLLNDSLLLYATGGVAYGQVGVSGNVNVTATAPGPGFTFGPTTSAFSQSTFNVGWTLGGGLEGRFLGWLSPNWTWKVEYLYVDLGWVNDVVTPFSAVSSTTLAGPLNGSVRTNTHFTDNIVRVGVNYHFGGPVVARY